jgi:16S rRNA (uracil1498-N3)-methyltransferase
MHRCLIDPEQWSDTELVLPESESRHLAQVLRAREGDPVELLDGRGRYAPAEIVTIRRARRHAPASVTLRLRSPARTAPRTRPAVELVVAIPKGSRMDGLIEKAVEVGVSAIRPVQTAHVVVHLSTRQAAERSERWRRIAESAVRQSGNRRLPVVHPVTGLAEALAAVCGEADLTLLGALTSDAVPLREVLESARARVIGRVAVLIGPEGDFTADEIAAARRAGALAVSFGDTVLRVDTAALYALSAVRCMLG